MKKLLSVILAIIMVATLVPMAFAEEACEHVFDEETLVRPCFVDNAYVPGSFVCGECGETVEAGFADFTEFVEVYGCIYGLYASIYVQGEENAYGQDMFESYVVSIEDICYLTNYEQDVVDAAIALMKEDLAEMKTFIAENEYIAVLDLTQSAISQIKEEFLLIYNYSGPETLKMREEAAEEFVAGEEYWSKREHEILSEIISEYGGQYAKVPANLIAELQEYYDWSAAFFNQAYDCVFLDKHDVKEFTDCGDGTHIGNCSFCTADNITETHTWGEYTENADGTMTAKCTDCTATDSIIVEEPDIEEPDVEEPDVEEPEVEEPSFEELNIAEKLIELIKDFLKLLKELLESIFG